uniref:SAGLIN n=1 Tax=Anopheles gambiae TaxID=7165 RepID=L7ZES6_ANOGA|nr:SAGLIN [Anopheles gambiae]
MSVRGYSGVQVISSRKHRSMSRLPTVLLLLASAAVLAAGGQEATEDPFADETDQCQISVSAETMKSLHGGSMQPDGTCDNLWESFLSQFHQVRENLTACQERAAAGPAPDPSSQFCQQLLDDAQRQMEQDRQYAATLEEQLHAAQQETQQEQEMKKALQKQLDALTDSRNALYIDLLLANIAIGETKQALSYYNLMPASMPIDKLHEQIVRFVYRVTIYQDQRLLNLMRFVRDIPSVEERRSLYQLAQREVQKRPSQRDGYVAAVYALSVREDLPVYQANRQLYDDLVRQSETRLKEQVANGNFKQAAELAARQPQHFRQLQTSLATIELKHWRKVDQAVKKQLEELRGKFATFAKGKNYQHYLSESRKSSG